MKVLHLEEQIFEQIENKDQKKFTEAGKHWNDFISSQKMPWIRMIHKYVNCSEPWPDFFKKSNLETIKVIAKTMLEYDAHENMIKQPSKVAHNSQPAIFSLPAWLP